MSSNNKVQQINQSVDSNRKLKKFIEVIAKRKLIKINLKTVFFALSKRFYMSKYALILLTKYFNTEIANLELTTALQNAAIPAIAITKITLNHNFTKVRYRN